MRPPFDHIRTWIFDLDNTLYPAETDLFALIDERMGTYVADLMQVDLVEARRIQKDYYYQHGTTLAGLMLDHGVDPHHFLDYVHDIDMGRIEPCPVTAAGLAQLPGRKLIFTNGDVTYAGRVLDRLGLRDQFEAIHDIHATQYQPKPHAAAYASLVDSLAIDPAAALFVDDLARNLKPAKQLGITTVWMNNGSDGGTHEAEHDFIDHEISALGKWLTALTQETAR
ncbi:MAG: pyrimidine 5'-nucleotidase [Blastomonas fulva]|uniref:pyrimidine 5'-nucleotidase n=1 Tax=Blastomonas fulva TaxID=1550728 RepID=UPI00403359F3